jgi:hypothetical protein
MQLRPSVSCCDCRCQGFTLSERQQAVQRAAFDERIELKRKEEHDSLMPPVFTMVPPVYPDGETPKKLCGWMLVRQVPTNNKPLHKFGEVLASELDQHDDTDDENDYAEDDKPLIDEAGNIGPEDTKDINEVSGKGNTARLEMAEGASDVLSLVSSEDQSMKSSRAAEEFALVKVDSEDVEDDEEQEFRYLEGLPPGTLCR